MLVQEFETEWHKVQVVWVTFYKPIEPRDPMSCMVMIGPKETWCNHVVGRRALDLLGEDVDCVIEEVDLTRDRTAKVGRKEVGLFLKDIRKHEH